MQSILENKQYRKLFYIIFVLTCVVLLLVRYLVIPVWDPALKLGPLAVLAALTERLLPSFIVTVAIGAFIYYIQPESTAHATLVAIDPKEIGGLLDTAVMSSTIWSFRGVMGRHFRAVTLPKLAAQGKKTSTQRDVTVQLLDPANIESCKQYAHFRKSLYSAKNDTEWSAEFVGTEICVTVLAILAHKIAHPRLNITVYLLSSFSEFRFDIASDYAIITIEDERAPGLRCDQSSTFYKSYLSDLALSARQARPFQLTAVDQGLTAASVLPMLKDLMPQHSFSIQEAEELVRRIETSKSPYA